MRRLMFSALLAFAVGSIIPANPQDSPRVLSFSPQGTVKQVRQVRVRFSEPMVPFGDLRDVAGPFEVNCPEKGTPRWIDERNWAYDFERDLPACIACEFNLRNGLKTLSGKDLTGQKRFLFTTGGPAIRSIIPYEGSEQIQEDQVFVLELDGPVSVASVTENAWLTVQGISERVGIRIVSGTDRDEIIRSMYRYRRETPPNLLLIQAKQRFPAGAKVNLVWGKGVSSPNGVTGETDRVLPFRARTQFTATFECTRENPQAQCVPIAPMRLLFSAPVPAALVKGAILIGPGGRKWAPEPDEDESGEKVVYALNFKSPFPENAEFTLQIPAGIRDESGRALSNARNFPVKVHTDEYPPLVKFAADFGILELNADPMLPVTVRNVEPQLAARSMQVEEANANTAVVIEVSPEEGALAGKMDGKILRIPSDRASQMFGWISKIGRRSWEDRSKSIFTHGQAEAARKFTVPKLQGPKAFEVLGIPMKAPGFYVVEIESAILGSSLLNPPKPMYVPTAVLVTNLAAHFKWGIDSSLVWVTSLDRGKPVAQAEVRIEDCQGKSIWTGKTDRDGIARTGPLPQREKMAECPAARFGGGGLVVTAKLGSDFTFVHSSWDEGIEPWRFRLPSPEYQDRLLNAHAVLDRSLFRAGETVHMKNFLRRRVTAGLALAPADIVPNSMLIQHLGSSQRYSIPLQWDGKGISESTWAIPKDAKLGNYIIYFGRKPDRARPTNTPSAAAPASEEAQETELEQAGEFRVEEFRVPIMKGVIRPPAAPQVAPNSVPVDLAVNYLAGGGAGNLAVRLRSQILGAAYVSFEQFEDFTFANGQVKEGITRGETNQEQTERFPLKSLDLTLDRLGTSRSVIADLPKLNQPMDMLTELEFKDPKGEIATISSRIRLWPSSRLVGIKPFSWGLTKESLKFQAAVTDLQGKPVAGANVRVDLLERKVYSHRKRLLGGFYAYEHSTEIKKLKSICEGKTDAHGLLFCDQPSPASGNLILQAVVKDNAGRDATAWQDVWIAGEGQWWFAAKDEDRIDIIPEKKRYEPGEKARLQVRMPFRSATALVSLEREGVGDTFIKELSGNEPVIEIPVKGSYSPNIFVSVLVVRGRVGEIQPTATVDLGRPSYKLGIAEINVGWRDHELKVQVASDRPVYKVREKARISISVRLPDGKQPPAGAEIAVAAVDEGLLELSPNHSWRLLEAMMGRRTYAVQTSTAQMHVIGKRHFGLKALPPGGGGGNQITRELFDTLLLWQGRVALDKRGQATVEIPLNDSITSFRIVAVANQGIERFGTGSVSIRTTQDLMIFSAVSPVIREGDRFHPEFTLRNATERAMKIQAALRVKEAGQTLKPIDVDLAPSQAKEITWDLIAPNGQKALTYELEAKEGSTVADRLRVTQKVLPAVPVRTVQATLTQVSAPVRVNVAAPADALPGMGGVQVSLSPSIIGSLTGVIDYMAQYPYTCLEQNVSKAVVLKEAALWDRVTAQFPSYLDSDGLAKYFPQMRLGSDVLTSYVLAISHESGLQIPADVRGLMTAGLRGFIEGRVIRYSALPTADLSIRKVAAAEALSRYEKIDPGLLSSITVDPNLWPTSAVIDWLNVLKAVPGLRNRDSRLKEADQVLRSRLLFQGTTMGFSTERTDGLWWLMTSTDRNAVRLVLSVLNAPAWQEDLPRLIRGVLGRQTNGHWDTTVANAWGTQALTKYAQAFEKTAVTGSTAVGLGGKTEAVDWIASPAGRTILFPWPAQADTLSVSQSASGSPYATIQSLAAIPLQQPISSGLKIQKTMIPIEQKEKGVWSQGDIVRVRLELESAGDMTWIVVNDPVPAGATILGTGLGRDSLLATKGEENRGWVWPAFEERSYDSFRSYYEFVPKGSWTVEYTVRLNARGVMKLPPSRIEALYSPEMFGEIPNASFEIR
jgi:alpha-2-macroglobulin